jgi:hypothetical protein
VLVRDVGDIGERGQVDHPDLARRAAALQHPHVHGPLAGAGKPGRQRDDVAQHARPDECRTHVPAGWAHPSDR